MGKIKMTANIIRQEMIGTDIFSMIIQAKEITLFPDAGRERLLNLDAVYNIRIVQNFVKRIGCLEGKISNAIRKLLLRAGEAVNFGRFCTKMIVGGIAAFIVLAIFFISELSVFSA